MAEATVSNTPFAAMIAKQHTNYAATNANQEQKRININYGIGVPGKDSVKEVCNNDIRVCVYVCMEMSLRNSTTYYFGYESGMKAVWEM